MKNTISIGMLISFLLPAYGFTSEFDQDVPENIQKQILDDLAFMGTLKGNQQSDFHKQIFGPLSGESYTNFFESRIERIGLNSCGDPNAVACVIPFFDSSKMWITQNYIKFSHPQIARLMVVYHEARHTENENGNWRHATCPNPFNDESGKPLTSIWTGAKLAGMPACDETPFGSYGSSLILLKNISKYCENCNEKVKQDAGIYSDNQLLRIINEQAKIDIQNDLK